MAARKKITPVAVPVVAKPKRFEVGYRFPIMAELTSISESADDDCQYRVSVEVWGTDSEDGFSGDCWLTEKDFIELESECNKNANKEYLGAKLASAKALVQSLTKQIESL